MSIPQDVVEFLEKYPDNIDDPNSSANYEFYANSRHCRPDNRLIDEIHEQWAGDYGTLERKHGYIQWLFPIQEHGMNYQSQPLQRHEIEAMRANSDIIDRIVRSYQMMLDFYGMRLISVDSGLVDRSLPPRNYASRYKNLVRSSHNYLRISRILKCLSEFGLERLNVGFLLHVLCEQSNDNELNTPGICSSMDSWWANCLRDEESRERVGGLIRRVRGDEGFVFTRDMYKGELGVRGVPMASQNKVPEDGDNEAANTRNATGQVTEGEEKPGAAASNTEAQRNNLCQGILGTLL